MLSSLDSKPSNLKHSFNVYLSILHVCVYIYINSYLSFCLFSDGLLTLSPGTTETSDSTTSFSF